MMEKTEGSVEITIHTPERHFIYGDELSSLYSGQGETVIIDRRFFEYDGIVYHLEGGKYVPSLPAQPSIDSEDGGSVA